MRMHGLGQIPSCRPHFHRQHPFADQFARAGAHNAHPQHPFRLGLDDQLGQTIRAVKAERPPRS